MNTWVCDFPRRKSKLASSPAACRIAAPPSLPRSLSGYINVKSRDAFLLAFMSREGSHHQNGTERKEAVTCVASINHVTVLRRDDSRLGVLKCCCASTYLQLPCEVLGDAGRYRYVAAAMHYTEGRQQRPGRAHQKRAVGILQSLGNSCRALSDHIELTQWQSTEG